MNHEEDRLTPPHRQPGEGTRATPPATFEVHVPGVSAATPTTTEAQEAGTIIVGGGGQATSIGRTFIDDVALQRALDLMGLKVRYEERRQRFQLTDGGGLDWEDFDTPGLTALRFTIARAFTYTVGKDDKAAEKPLKYGRDSFRDALLALADARREDSFKVWLEGLPTWDGVDRASRWIADLFQPGGPPALTRWAALSIPLAAVSGGPIEPGCKHDECRGAHRSPGVREVYRVPQAVAR